MKLRNLNPECFSAAHGTNLDRVWIRANEARLLNKGSVFKFGASSREYKVPSQHLKDPLFRSIKPSGSP